MFYPLTTYSANIFVSILITFSVESEINFETAFNFKRLCFPSNIISEKNYIKNALEAFESGRYTLKCFT